MHKQTRILTLLSLFLLFLLLFFPFVCVMSKVAVNERISQILPTVKCSDCGKNVHIRHLGDHLCSNVPSVPPLPILPMSRHESRQPYSTATPTKSPTHIPTHLPLKSPTAPSLDNTRLGYGSSASNDSRYPTPPTPVTPSYPTGPRENVQPSYRPINTSSTSLHSQHSQHSQHNLHSPRIVPPLHSPSTPTSHYGHPSQNNSAHGAYKNSRSPSPYEMSPKSPNFRQDETTHDIRSNLGIHYQERSQSATNDLQSRSYNDTMSQSYTSRNTSGPLKQNSTKGGSTGALDSLMADLMNSMHDIHEVDAPVQRTPTSPSCHVCHEEFDYRDSVTTVGTKYYHKACYQCQLCRVPLDPRQGPFEHQGSVYCERDYNVIKQRVSCAAW
ncbi:hypothetical protein BDF14DRAFT_1799092 [Spinellus fusiger]|nr:hypothetical protein BDF14DRAFT_1799092 [Spinellus fusiger]